MGAAVAEQAARNAAEVMWCSAGRSSATRVRAESAGLTSVSGLGEFAARCELIVSLCPPAKPTNSVRPSQLPVSRVSTSKRTSSHRRPSPTSIQKRSAPPPTSWTAPSSVHPRPVRIRRGSTSPAMTKPYAASRNSSPARRLTRGRWRAGSAKRRSSSWRTAAVTLDRAPARVVVGACLLSRPTDKPHPPRDRLGWRHGPSSICTSAGQYLASPRERLSVRHSMRSRPGSVSTESTRP